MDRREFGFRYQVSGLEPKRCAGARVLVVKARSAAVRKLITKYCLRSTQWIGKGSKRQKRMDP